MGQVYIGVLPVLLLLAVGVFRKKLWRREIRFFSLAIAALLFYALGRYTVVFHWLYDYLPGVNMFRRPADATYALGAMTAIASGYFLHLLLTGDEAPSKTHGYWVLGILAAVFATALGVAARHDHLYEAIKPLLVSAALFGGGWLALQLSAQNAQRYVGLTVAGLAAFMTVDLAIGNGPNRSTAKPPSQYEELRADTKNETVAFDGPISASPRIPSGGSASSWLASVSNGPISASSIFRSCAWLQSRQAGRNRVSRWDRRKRGGGQAARIHAAVSVLPLHHGRPAGLALHRH